MDAGSRDVMRVLAALLLSNSASAATNAELHAAIDAGTRAAIAALDDKGMARGDYEMVAGRWEPFEPAWHTGQLALGLVDAWRITGDPKAMAAARRAGDWWLSQEIKGDARFTGMIDAWHGGRLGRLINFTTVTNGTKGLYQLSQASGDRRYGDAATRAIAWLVRTMRVPGEPLFYNIVDRETAAIWKDRSPHHPQARPAVLNQVARPNIEGSPFADACEWTGDKAMCALQIEIADGLLQSQHDNGLWMDFEPNDPETGKIHPRFNIWNAEALIRTYDLTKERKYLDASIKAMQAIARLQRPDGTIYYDNFTDGRFREGSFTGSATAFAGHQWLKLKQRGAGALFDANIDRSLAWVLANRYADDHPDPNLAGAFIDTRVRMTGGKASMVNRADLAAAFALRFLTAVARDQGMEHKP